MANESNLDLDIDNYSMNDFKKFFNLTDNDKIGDITKKIDETTNKLLFSDNTKYGNEIKKEILSFINKAKHIIISKNTGQNLTQMVSGAPHYVQAINSIPEKYVNPAEFNSITRLIVFNSIYSDKGLANGSNNTYTFTFPEHIKNVTGINLGAVQYPNVELAFSDYKGNNLMYIQENYTSTIDSNSNPTTENVDGKSATIRLPPGTYSAFPSVSTLIISGANQYKNDFANVLEFQINSALGYPTSGVDSATTSIFTLPRYHVTIDPNSYNTTISSNLNPNTTQYPLSLAYSKSLNANNDFSTNFTMVFDKPTWSSNASTVCTPGLEDNPTDPNFPTLTQGYQYNNLQYRSLGYQMGFREIINQGSSSYTSLSIYNSNITNYVYFSLEDYIPNRIDNVTGMFSNSVFDKNILALIPITSPAFTSTLDSGANFIFKTRNYSGPVNLQKISVTFYDPNGFISQLNGTPFSFALELKIAYENPILSGKASIKGLGVGFDESAI
jgi:hypothetical protein